MSHLRILATAIVFLMATSYSGSFWDNEDPKLIAFGPTYAVHLFAGAVGTETLEASAVPGLVVSHVDLRSGEMKWLFSTGTFAIPTRRVSYTVRRLVGLVQDEERLIVALFVNGSLFTEQDRPPREPVPERAYYMLRVFSKKEGVELSQLGLHAHASFPEILPPATTGAGVLKREEKGYRIFDRSFTIDSSGQLSWRK